MFMLFQKCVIRMHFNTIVSKLETWLSSSENMLLFQRIRALFPAPTHGTTHPPATPAPPGSDASGFTGNCTHVHTPLPPTHTHN